MINNKEIDKQYVANTYARFDIEIVDGKGSRVVDSNGKEYIDLATGIAVNTFGIADKEWTDAVTAQLGKFQTSIIRSLVLSLQSFFAREQALKRCSLATQAQRQTSAL